MKKLLWGRFQNADMMIDEKGFEKYERMYSNID